MRKILFAFLSFIVVACSSSDNFTLEGTIKGLKKGTVYLMRAQDSTFVTVDSVEVSGDPSFILSCNLSEPEALFVKLDKKNGVDNYLEFFAAEGITTLQANLKTFPFEVEVVGSEQQKTYNDYQKMLKNYSDKHLELTELFLIAQIKKDSVKLDSLQTSFDHLIKSKYRYCLNYAITHGDSEVAPYIGLAEIPDATVQALDTLYSSLSPKVKGSKYGLMLNEELIKRKSE